MIWLINYADETFKDAQHYNSYTAKHIGKVDKVIEYGPENIERAFLEKNKQWFVKGDAQIGKYGLWRPMIIRDAYMRISEGEFLMYADAGTFFVNDVHYLTELMLKKNINVLVFSIPFVEKHWSKRDIFIKLNADTEEIANSNQRMSTCFIIRKSGEGEEFIERYQKIAVNNPELFTDDENILGEENYSGFIQNRHNQSVLSILTKTMGIVAYRDPTEYGSREKLYSFYELKKGVVVPAVYEESPYPQILIQHRRGKITLWVKVYGAIRSRYPYFISKIVIKLASLRQKVRM